MKKSITMLLMGLLLTLTTFSQSIQINSNGDTAFLVEAWRLRAAACKFVLLEQAEQDLIIYQDKSINDEKTIASLDSLVKFKTAQIGLQNEAIGKYELMSNSYEKSLQKCSNELKQERLKRKIVSGVSLVAILFETILLVVK